MKKYKKEHKKQVAKEIKPKRGNKRKSKRQNNKSKEPSNCISKQIIYVTEAEETIVEEETLDLSISEASLLSSTNSSSNDSSFEERSESGEEENKAMRKPGGRYKKAEESIRNTVAYSSTQF